MKIAHVHGIFFPFHKGHLDLVLNILKKYDFLYIGIANPLRKLPANINEYPDYLKNSLLKARLPYKNIFTYLEREQMILRSLQCFGVDLSKIKILPQFGCYEEENWKDFIPCKSNCTLVICPNDVHHDFKIDYYKKDGWKIDILDLPRLTSGTNFHNDFPDGDWEKHLPKGSADVIKENFEKILIRRQK